jgi:hypothetical protein
MAYSKLYSSIVHSSLWTEPDHIRILFITLFAIADREGYVYGSRKGLLRLANVDMDQCDEHDPFEALMAPDPDSSDLLRNPENEGRRIEEVPGGFRILNFLYYRGLRNEDDRREQNKEAQRRHRSKQKSADVSHGQQMSEKSAKVSHAQPASAKLSHDKPISEAEADTEAEEEEDKEEEENARKRAHPISQKEVEDFCASIGLATSDGEAMWLLWQSQGYGKTKDWKAKIRQWKIQGYHPSQKQQALYPTKPKEPAPYYPPLPPKRIPTDEELATAQRIAKQETEALRAKLHSS